MPFVPPEARLPPFPHPIPRWSDGVLVDLVNKKPSRDNRYSDVARMMETWGPVGSEAARPLEAGTRLGEYEIRRLIGLGSMSAIYEAVRPDTGRRVAIKVLSPNRAALPDARERFLREAKLTARLRHAHIVDVIEVCEDGEWIYIAMEMLEGEDLGRLLEHVSVMSIAETADILVPVCEAVAAAHDSGIVHRDLKPSNIFVAIRDQKTRSVVLDFGVANDNASSRAEAGIVDDAGGVEAGIGGKAGSVSRARLIFGTPYYLSPEQVVDHRAASPSSDQWALGVILYECLTGARPYDADGLDDVFAAIREGNVLSPRERRSDIPAELEQIVMRAMSSDPRARFGSVAELAAALRPFRSEVGRARSPSRRRAPSSPAIEAEASARSPFLRTLTPEVDVLDGLWFEPDPAEETSGATLSPAGSSRDERSEAENSMASEASLIFDSRWTPRSPSSSDRRVPGRKFPGPRIGAAAGGALGGLVLLFFIFHGGSADRRVSQRTATASSQAIEQGAAASVTPSIGQVERAPPAAKEPAITNAPTVAGSLSVAKEATAPREPTDGKEPVATKEPTLMEPVAKPPGAPAGMPSSTAGRRVRARLAPSDTLTATRSAARDAAARPTARASSEVRMHNGVPLLD